MEGKLLKFDYYYKEVDNMEAMADRVRTKVREEYGKAARSTPVPRGLCCVGEYNEEELARIPPESILGLGSGNPVRHAGLRGGEVVVDLGSGSGVDAFLAASLVGPDGRVVGIDMTPEMLARARATAEGRSIRNVDFREGVIESLPLPDGLADVVVSNCVINLSPDKASVFREAFRVLKLGGRLVVSDVVQERPLGPIEDTCGCVATAMVRGDYLKTIEGAGFEDLRFLEDRPWRTGPAGLEASSITVRAAKPPKGDP